MKLSFSVLALFFVLISCKKEDSSEKETIAAISPDADVVFYGLKGNVKSVTEKSVRIDTNGNIIEPGHENPSERDMKLEFDENGMLVAVQEWTNKGQPYSRTDYSGGRQKKKLEINYINGVPGIETEYTWDLQGGNNVAIERRNADKSPLSRIEMRYDSGRIVEKNTFDRQNNPDEKITYIYDAKGNLIEENQVTPTESVNIKTVYAYDANNKKTSDTRYSKGNVIYTVKYEYDGDNLAKKEVYSPNGELEYRQEFTYDEKGNMLSESLYDKLEDLTTINSYTYNAKGDKTEWLIDKNGKRRVNVTYTYDKYGNLTAVKGINKDGQAVNDREYTYEYDEKGNWIKKSSKLYGDPAFVITREIEYY